MENQTEFENQICWNKKKNRFGKNIEYKNTLTKHSTSVSILKEMYIDGVLVRQDLLHIPFEIIDKLNLLLSK